MWTAPVPDLGDTMPRSGTNFTALSETTKADLSHAIHVWQFPDLPPERLKDLRFLLSEDEVERADRFHFAHHRDAFIANRGRLRALLGHYLECPPQEMRFKYGPQGKPSVAAAEERGLAFNISHTDGLAVVAVAQGTRVGIDVEKVKDVAEMLDIARLHFSPAEYRQLCTIAPQEQLRAFFACWTRKEAFLKGLGEGLNRPLNQLEVGFVPGHTAEPPACEWAPLLGRSWRISAIGLGEGYLGAVAYEGDDSTGPRAIRTFRFSELTSLRI